MKSYKNDILIIGSGAAGLRCAIEAHEKGADVLVLGKCKRGDAHTVLATGGINAALGTMDPKDSWLVHAADTLKEGRFIADSREVETLCKEAPRAINDLIEYGVRFHEEDGRLTQRFFGAHTYRRTCFVGDRTGKAMEEALVKRVTKMKIPFLEGVYITSLMKRGGRVCGAFGFDTRTGEHVLFKSKAVVLATGGYSRLYRRSSSRIFENTGDGVTLAYNAGAALADMEMVQFHPTGMVWPSSAEGVLVTEAVRGEGGVLTNAKGERFMKAYDARAELGPRDIVARAIYSEIQAGRGTKHNGVWLDVSHLPKQYIKERLPKIYEQFNSVGVDVSKERMEVAPTAHYTMGGVRVSRTTQETSVPGLFAVGEVTSGVHGANRLGGNSLLETIVFGRICGSHVAAFVEKRDTQPPDDRQLKRCAADLEKIRAMKGQYVPQALRAELQSMMWENAGIVRDGKKMSHSLGQLNVLATKSKKMHVATGEEFIVALDFLNLLTPAEAVLRSALVRRESRGAHYRSDYPQEGKKWTVNLTCQKGSGSMIVRQRRVPKPAGVLAHMLKKEIGRKVEHRLLE